jgi:hypothetical protein
MNNDRRRLWLARPDDISRRSEPDLDALIGSVATHDLDELGRRQAEPDACPSLTRHRRAALRHDWSPQQLAHVETCSRCRRTRDTVSSAVWHPEVRLLAGRLAGAPATEDQRAVEQHLADDGCQRCERLLASPWLRLQAERARERTATVISPHTLAGPLVVACGELPRAVGEFATDTRPPFELRAVASRGDLVVTLRETDQGQLVVHVEAPNCGEGGQTVRVELLGDGEPVVALVEMKAIEGEPGCTGRHAFGPFVELVPRMRPAVALLAVLAEKAES